MKKLLFIALSFLSLSSVNASGKLEIAVFYERQVGRGSNQYAVWIEDADNNLVKTLFVTNFTAKGGYTYRTNSIPLWVEKANPSLLSEEQIDVISGATPQTGIQQYTWDLTDMNGDSVSPGTYTFVVQGTLLNDNQATFKGDFEVGGSRVSMEPVPEYSNLDPLNTDMIPRVNAEYIPE